MEYRTFICIINHFDILLLWQVLKLSVKVCLLNTVQYNILPIYGLNTRNVYFWFAAHKIKYNWNILKKILIRIASSNNWVPSTWVSSVVVVCSDFYANIIKNRYMSLWEYYVLRFLGGKITEFNCLFHKTFN